MSIIDPEKIGLVIKDVVNDKILPRFQNLKQGDIRSKTSPQDLVTIADEEAEQELTRHLTALLPGSICLGEEAISKGHTSRAILQSSIDTPIWIIDPVDGTSNFARGAREFGTMLCLVHKGVRQNAWIYRILDDRLYIGQRGDGITINRVDYRPFTRSSEPQATLNGRNGFISTRYMPESFKPHINKNLSLLKTHKTFFCCAYEYTMLLDGEVDFSIYRRIEPWDHMAGVLLLEEAGFHTQKWDQTPYTVYDIEGGLINAQSAEMAQSIYKTFLEVPLSAHTESNPLG